MYGKKFEFCMFHNIACIKKSKADVNRGEKIPDISFVAVDSTHTRVASEQFVTFGLRS
jgi:hypothetical protein